MHELGSVTIFQENPTNVPEFSESEEKGKNFVPIPRGCYKGNKIKHPHGGDNRQNSTEMPYIIMKLGDVIVGQSQKAWEKGGATIQ
jgi:hypothetical protein